MTRAGQLTLAAPGIAPITPEEFSQFQRFIYQEAGITLASTKEALVGGRLGKRLQQCGVGSYGEYMRLLSSGTAPAEVQIAIDLLTTNETHFFREAKHFDLLREVASASSRTQPFRVWSAASSTGEEPYSIAMVLADCREASPWEVVGSDISTRVLAQARRGHYPLSRSTHIPPQYLKRFCLRGVGEQEGTLLIDRKLRGRVNFLQVNLNAPLNPQLGLFEVIFLRNVMIYFNEETKRQVMNRLLAQLRPGGHLLVGHSESLHGICDALKHVGPSVYRKP